MVPRSFHLTTYALNFRGSVSRIGGMSLQDLQRESEALWSRGFPEKAMTKLEDFGFIQSKAKVRGNAADVMRKVL